MIFAAGLGTRLAPLTDTCPKALIDVGGRPMLERAVVAVREAGATRVVVNVHHHAGMIIDFLAKSDFGVEIVVSDETERLLDTGGGVVKAHDLISDAGPVILYNADIYTDLSLSDMVNEHIRSGADATLLVADRATSRYLIFNQAGRMVGWTNRSTGEMRSPFALDDMASCRLLAFGGIHIVSPHVISDMVNYCPDGKFSITTYYVDRCGQFDFHSYLPAGRYNWIDIGKPDSLAKARKVAAEI
ncbi:MAG: nucleotidyltransferase family protein [Duncaniella sp.]|nr:nucleotidyltransferase family protein [Duncaniella sp.]